MSADINFHIRNQARQMYWRGYSVAQISRDLDTPYPTVDAWKRREKWDDAPIVLRVENAIDMRLCQLIDKPDKTETEFRELDALTRSLERTARIKRYEAGGNEADLNPRVRNRNSGKRRRSLKNHLDDAAVKRLEQAFMKGMFRHQKEWHRALAHPVRQIVKSRQIGATLHFSREAIVDAARHGKNKIFISASKNQAQVFKRNIINFVREAAEVELRGDPIVLSNGAELHFLGTNKNTAQSYSGDLYIDEYFWIPNFADIEHVASGMAILDDRRITYFSTPSTINHQAYALWDGSHFNAGRPKKDHIDIDVSHKALRAGAECADGIWRQIVTIEDAIGKGYSLVTMEKLRKKFPPSKFENLLLCKFIDDSASVFPLSELQSCMVDALGRWDDYRPDHRRPFGDRPVWIGYDPSETQDDASLVVIAPPRQKGGKFRFLEKYSWQGMNFDAQAAHIRKMCARFHVAYIGIDATGAGAGVFQLVRKFYPNVKRISYSIEVKTNLVLKAKQLFSHGLVEFDASWTDLAHAFMTINQTTTQSGGNITYRASRTKTTGHADLAWAAMHALDKQDLDSVDKVGASKKSFMEIF